jgi:hypothetical protein
MQDPVRRPWPQGFLSSQLITTSPSRATVFAVRFLDAPYFVLFVCCALLVAWFRTVRRRVEHQLLQTRDRLVAEVAKRTQQVSLLNLTHDSIFVRDMDFIIDNWNHGSELQIGRKRLCGEAGGFSCVCQRHRGTGAVLGRDQRAATGKRHQKIMTTPFNVNLKG